MDAGDVVDLRRGGSVVVVGPDPDQRVPAVGLSLRQADSVKSATVVLGIDEAYRVAALVLRVPADPGEAPGALLSRVRAEIEALHVSGPYAGRLVDLVGAYGQAMFNLGHPEGAARTRTVADLTRDDFGQLIRVEGWTKGYLYGIRDEFADGYPFRVLALVEPDHATAVVREFTDSDPAQYPKTLRTPVEVLEEVTGRGDVAGD